MFNRMGGVKKQKGFTLIEVLTVMLVLVAVASVTVETASELAFQGRYEVTKDRYEKIRKAIMGDPNQIVNGQPNISGFVADVGRLPFALQELLDDNFCTDTRYFIPADCTTNGGVWTATPNWNGPYISSTQLATDTRALSDGWGNTGNGNYGWDVKFFDGTNTQTFTIAVAVSMNIQSKGKNQILNIADTGYDIDYPPIQPSIRSQDWQVNINNVSAIIMASSITGTCAPFTPTDPATCSLTGGTWTPPCTGAILPNSKLGCESAGSTWGFGTLTNLCIKLIRNSISYISNPNQSITEDGREHLIPFLIPTGTNVPMGKAIGIIHNDTNCTSAITYPSANQYSICMNNPNSPNFTQANCENNGGIWVIDDSPEQYCDGVVGNACTNATGSNLGGTEHPKFQITLIPLTTLPPINW